jgi:hypothetical protein
MNFLPALQLTFIILKLTKVIAWSWWLVLLPTILPVCIVGLLIIIYTFLLLIEHFLK